MEREIKFRVWRPSEGMKGYMRYQHIPLWRFLSLFYVNQNDVLLQYTGRKDKNGDEIYECDIFRVEEDEESLIYYLVIVWVNEWSMFCALRCDDEYQEYLRNGIEALDEPMFWTYTLEDTADRRFFKCGNIYETPDLVNYAGGAVLDE